MYVLCIWGPSVDPSPAAAPTVWPCGGLPLGPTLKHWGTVPPPQPSFSYMAASGVMNSHEHVMNQAVHKKNIANLQHCDFLMS